MSTIRKRRSDPCWDGYVQLGMKKKKGRLVPNCVPKKKKVKTKKKSARKKSTKRKMINKFSS